MAHVYLRNKGGIGNQLFMYSFAKSIAIQTGSKLYIDNISGFAKDPYKRYPSLQCVVSNHNCVAGSLFQLFFKCFRLLPAAIRKMMGICFLYEKNTSELIHIDINKIKKCRIVFIEGYFQSYKYFLAFNNVLFGPESLFVRFTVASSYKKHFNAIAQSNAVSVHVRRVQYNDKLPVAYYNDAFDVIRNKVIDPVFFVFSDDLEWCRANFIGKYFFFVSVVDPDEIQELYLMTHCKHHIIANSSFSWWGAWLAHNEHKVVVAPKATTIGVEDAFYPLEWMVV